MKFRITFKEWENTSAPGFDGVEYGFPFLVIDLTLAEEPEAVANTQEHRGLVSITRSRLASWHLAELEIQKVLFEFAKCEVEKVVAQSRLPAEGIYTFRLLNLTT